MTNEARSMMRTVVPGLILGLAVHFVPGAAGEWCARALACAAAGSIVASAWWLWRGTRGLPTLSALAKDARVHVDRLREIAEERERWAAATLAVHRRARDHFAATGHRELAAQYDKLIASMEGRSYDGAVN